MSITGSNNPFACEPVVFANANAIVSLGTITRDGNEFTFSVGFVWKINGVTYQNTAPVVLTIAEASTGFERIDNALLNTSNTIELQQGLESETIALQPVAPDTNIILTSWNISGASIEDTSDPILGTQFVKKTDNSSYSISQSGTNVALEIPANGASMLFLTNAALVSVSGFSLVNITGNPAAEVPYNGKPFFIVNNTGVSVTLNHDETADVPFMFVAVSDIVMPPSGIIEIRYAADGMSEVFKSWSEVDLSTKLDKDTTAGVERAYIINADGSQGTKPTSDFSVEIYTEVTKTELDALIANSELIPNALYKITGCEAWMVLGDATESLYLKAISNNELSKSGMGRFYTPKYATDEIWKGEIYEAFPADFPIAPSYNIGDKVIWGGRLWINTNGNLGTKINHFTLSADWEIVIFDSVSYDLSTDIIEYDYENDYVFFRKDNKGSEVSSSVVAWTNIENDLNGDPLSDSIYNPLKVYQWGNENCYGNLVYVGSILECVNSTGQIFNNTLSTGQIYNNTLSNGYIYNNTLRNSYIYNNALSNGRIYNNTLNSNGQIYNNTLSNGHISTNTLRNSYIYNNALSNGRIYNNTLSNGYISTNTLSSDGRIYNSTFSDCTITLSNTITQNITNLSINANINGDFSTATLIYATYSRDVFSNSNGVTKIKYFNENDVLIVADITD